MRNAEIGQKEVTGAGTVELPTGTYDVEANCPGLPPVAARVIVNRGATTSWLPWPKGYLDVQSDPTGAAIVVDGLERGLAPLVVAVEPGTLHHVEVRKDKYEAYSADVSAAVGDKTSLTPALVLLPGSIRVVTSIAGANVQLEGKNGKTPYLFENVQPGQHFVRIFDLRVGNRMYTVGDNVQVEVSPGETTLVSETFVEGKGHLTIEDAPAGSIITIDGKSVDSEKALTTGIDVPAGWMGVVVQGPDSQEWTDDTTFVGAGRDTALSVSNMALVLPRRTIKIDGKFDDWNGIPPAFTTSGKISSEKKNLWIDRVYLAVDEKNLYMRFDIMDATPSSFFHPNNFDTAHSSSYGILFSNGIEEANAEIGFYANRWQNNVDSHASGSWESVVHSSGNFAMNGSRLEAAFPLEPIRKLLGLPAEDGAYRVHAYAGYHDNQGQWIEGSADYSKTELLNFYPQLPAAFFNLVMSGTQQEVQTAIKRGANVNARDTAEMTPLMYAVVSNQNLQVVTTLLEAGAGVKDHDKDGFTALMLAARSNQNLQVIKTLLEAGAEVNAQDREGDTALTLAATSNQNPEVITALLNAGADAGAKDWLGKTALDYARGNKKLAGTDALRQLQETSQ